MVVDHRGTFEWLYEYRGATYYHVTRHGEIDQSNTGRDCDRMEAQLTDSVTKDTFPPDRRIIISKDDFIVIDRALTAKVL